MTTPYTTGQISLVNGSALVTGVGTGWETSLIIGGTIFVEADGGNALPILEIGGDTEITAAIAWTGATGTYDYALVRDTAYGQQTVANAQALADYIQRLNNTALSAVAGVSPADQTLLLFTGPDTATTIALSGLINGADYDVQVNNIAGRAVYDSRPANFRVLVADIGDGRSAIYSKNSNTAADWSAPAIITGPPGPDGVNPRGNYEPATAYVVDDLVYSGGSTWIAKVATTGNAPPTLPTTENTQWRIFARAGSAGVNPRGAYANGTTYAALDVVLNNGSSWIAKTTTTGNMPPVLPTTENAYWSLLAAKGTDGTGTGDVVGPASSVANRVATFSGTTGKAIQDSGVTLGNSASRNVGTTAGTVAAGDDARFSQGGNSQNEAILALEIADLKGSRLGMKGGVADAFDDETGVDVKTNAAYDATNDWYAPTPSDVSTKSLLHLDGANGSTAITDATGSRAWSASGAAKISTAQSVFGGSSLDLDGSSYVSSSSFSDITIGTGDFTIEAFVRFRSVSAYCFILDARNNEPQNSPSLYLRPPSGNKIVYYAGGAIRITGTTTPSVDSWYHVAVCRSSGVTRLFINGVQEGGNYADTTTYSFNAFRVGQSYQQVSGEGLNGYLDEFRLSLSARYTANFTPPSAPFTLPFNNMTLRSVVYAAASTPTTGRVAVQLVESDSITITTDLIARVSRDGGATWATASLSLSQSLIGPKMYEATGINLASLGSGTSMKWEVATANNKNVAVSGVVLQWS